MGSADTDRMYMCIDLKSFYASVECADLGLDPFTTPLVVADGSRGKGAITLAISPALKKLGVKNRTRLFQIPPHVEYLTVNPHMKRYMQVSAEIYGVLLKYVAPEDVMCTLSTSILSILRLTCRSTRKRLVSWRRCYLMRC